MSKAITKAKNGGAAGLKVPETTRMRLSDLHMAPYNPRVMPEAKMRALKASLRKHGLVLALVVQRHSEELGLDHVLVGGHQRVRAVQEICKEEGWPEPDQVPCTVLDIDDATAKQLNVSLNNVEGEFDPFKLGQMFQAIYPAMTSDDVLATGFIPEQIEEMRALVLPVDEQIAGLQADLGSMPDFGKSITLSVEFDTVEARDDAKARLKALAEESGKKPGKILAEAVKAWAATRPAPQKKRRAAS